MTKATLNPIWLDALDQLDRNNKWPNRMEPNKHCEFCGLSKPASPNYQVNIINQAPMFTFSSFVSSLVFSWKHHLPLEDAHRTLHISLLSIMTNRKSITGTKPSKYKQMPEKCRKKVEEYKGTCQKRFSGIRPLRGGGYPPFPLRKKTFFFSHWFSVKGGGGYPPFPLRKKTFFFSDWFSVKRGGGTPLTDEFR